MSTAEVYVCRDGEGQAIYVGASRHYEDRLETHRTRAFWWPSVRTVELFGPFSTWRRALDMEQWLLDAERPRFQQHGRWRSHPTWTVRDCDDYLLTLLNSPNVHCLGGRLEKVRALRQDLKTPGNTGI